MDRQKDKKIFKRNGSVLLQWYQDGVSNTSLPNPVCLSLYIQQVSTQSGYQYQYQVFVINLIVQILEIRAKYDKLETELRGKRDKTHTEIQEFMDNKLGVVLSDLRRELKLTEARLRDNHQVCGQNFPRLSKQTTHQMRIMEASCFV